MELIHPHGRADVAEALREASAAGTRILVVGGRRHMDKGNPCEVDVELWTTMLDRVIDYEPAEMLVTVEAGMRCGDLAKLLAEHRQEWPVDAPAEATVGGVIAAGVSSTRRLRVGHVRETVVAMEFLAGDGRTIHSGARTVKNATGYDLHRLLTGSLGTLGVIVEVTLKVRPLPAARRVLLTVGGGLDIGHRLLGAVPSAAEVRVTPTTVALRLEGWPGEVAQQEAAAREAVPLADTDATEDELPELPAGPTLLEIAVAPSRLAEALEGSTDWVALVGVGLAWVGAESAQDVRAVRDRVRGLGGIAPALRGPGGLGPIPPPDPPADPRAAGEVERRIARALDPAGILAPGRGWQPG